MAKKDKETDFRFIGARGGVTEEETCLSALKAENDKITFLEIIEKGVKAVLLLTRSIKHVYNLVGTHSFEAMLLILVQTGSPHSSSAEEDGASHHRSNESLAEGQCVEHGVIGSCVPT